MKNKILAFLKLLHIKSVRKFPPQNKPQIHGWFLHTLSSEYNSREEKGCFFEYMFTQPEDQYIEVPNNGEIEIHKYGMNDFFHFLN